eukprot:Selendium_serpulae@DN3696_c0_g1_i4.p1
MGVFLLFASFYLFLLFLIRTNPPHARSPSVHRLAVPSIPVSASRSGSTATCLSRHPTARHSLQPSGRSSGSSSGRSSGSSVSGVRPSNSELHVDDAEEDCDARRPRGAGTPLRGAGTPLGGAGTRQHERGSACEAMRGNAVHV